MYKKTIVKRLRDLSLKLELSRRIELDKIIVDLEEWAAGARAQALGTAAFALKIKRNKK